MRVPTKSYGHKLRIYVAKTLFREAIGDKMRGIPPLNPRFQEILVKGGDVDEITTLVPVQHDVSTSDGPNPTVTHGLDYGYCGKFSVETLNPMA